jgi:hypothetical protein
MTVAVTLAMAGNRRRIGFDVIELMAVSDRRE